MNARDDILRHPGVLATADAEIAGLLDAYRAEILAEAKVETVDWLAKKAREYRSTGSPQHALQADAIETLASKVDRGAIRAFLGTAHYCDAMDARRAEVLTELAAKADQRMAVGTSRLVTKATVRRFLELEASAARAAANTKGTPAAPAPDPEIAADTTRRAQLLYAMATQGGHWKSGRVLRWYALHGHEGLGVRDARRDLAALRDRGHIHQHDASGCRFFTTSLTKGDS